MLHVGIIRHISYSEVNILNPTTYKNVTDFWRSILAVNYEHFKLIVSRTLYTVSRMQFAKLEWKGNTFFNSGKRYKLLDKQSTSDEVRDNKSNYSKSDRSVVLLKG